MRRLSTLLLSTVALVPVMQTICPAATRPLTRHVRDVTVNGKAPLIGRLPANQSMRIVLVLPLRNQPALDSLLRDLYDPASPSFRQWLTVEQFTGRFGPTQADYDALRQFAESHGFTVAATSPNRMNMDVLGTVAAIENAFHLTMGVYEHPTENRTFFAPDREPSPDLSIPLYHIAGLDNYSIPRPQLTKRAPGVQANATTGSCPEASFCGSDMRAAYYGTGELTGTGQSLGLLEYEGTDLADLATYFTNVGQTDKVPVTLLSVDGTSTSCEEPTCDDTEPTIDMTQAISMAPGMSALIMYIGSSDSAIFNAMATHSPLNAQLSSSWTWYPPDATTLDPYLEEFAAQGQNYFQATGDGGHWVTGAEIWPADNQYVTGVGGTDLETASAGGPWASETAWSDGGGGISPNHVAIPSWQIPAADGCSACSTTYRNGPDVSANANFTFYVCADQTTCSANLYGGTSFAAPMWAGYLALANQQNMHKNGTTLGFINPQIYTIGLESNYDTNFHDITSGSNGYSATVGYDLATGWGSMNGPNLINTLTSPAAPGYYLSASPSAVTATQDASSSSTITVTATGGFDSTVDLSATGQPSGVTVGFTPTSVTGSGTSSMSISVASTVPVGTYTITVQGKSGSTTETTSVTLTVISAGSFTLSASPNTITISRGTSGTSTITAKVSGGFDSTITLSATGESNLTVTFNPTTIAGAGTSIMTVSAGKLATEGTRTITVVGTGGGLKAGTTVTVTVK
jgi:subtilase family serine protease